jgi:hypothetical protein
VPLRFPAALDARLPLTRALAQDVYDELERLIADNEQRAAAV